MTKPKILITGSSGLLGPYLSQNLVDQGIVFTTSRSRGNIKADLRNQNEVGALLREIKPDILIHSAALTDVEYCESSPENAELLNGIVVGHIVDHLPKSSLLIYFSSDQVYPDLPGPHQEGSAAPINVYGRSKLLGEQFASSHPETIILRTSFFGASRSIGRSSLSDFFVQGFRSLKPVVGYRDVQFSPLHMETVARFVVLMIDRGLRGIFNLGSREGLTKAEFARRIGIYLSLDTSMLVLQDSTSTHRRTKRPLDLRMDVSRCEESLGVKMPTLQEEINKL